MKHVPAFLVGLAVGALLLFGGLRLFGGSKDVTDPSRSVTQLPEATDAKDQDLMLALGQAKNFHHKAKVYINDGNIPAAIAAVRQILSLKFPAGAPEAEDVRNDARALLAKLLLGQGKVDEAMRTVNEGLAQSSRDSFFVANLYTVQGEIHEVRAANFDAEGKKPEATEARRAAIMSLDRSISINETIQKKLLGVP
jgi:hypothetical protein